MDRPDTNPAPDPAPHPAPEHADRPPISAQDVARVARLARLELSPEQADDARTKLAAILAYADRLAALDLANLEPLTHPGRDDDEQANRLAPDVPQPSLPNEAFMALAPDPRPPHIAVPRVLEDGGGGA